MSSYSAEVSCQQCNGSTMRHYEPSGESSLTCPACGYCEDKLLMDGTETSEEIEAGGWNVINSKDGVPLLKERKLKGHGVVCFSFTNGVSRIYPLARQLTEQVLVEIKQDFDDPDLNMDKCYITVWNDELLIVEVVFGTLPTWEY